MMVGKRGLRVDDEREGLGNAIEPRLVSGDDTLTRLGRGNCAGKIARLQVSPYPVAGTQTAERLNQLGIEPAVSALTHNVKGGLRSAESPVNFRHLGQPDDSRIERNLVAAEPFGIPPAIPMF